MSIIWDDHKELKEVKDVLMHRYELLEYLRGGGYGKVFKLKDKKLGRECALKVLNIDKLNESSDAEREEIKVRFKKEARAYAKCTHPNIPPIFDTGGEDTFPYFIMEYIKGESLKDVIAKKGKLSLTDVLKISEGVLSALECIHEHDLVHRDIKPANIMIEEESGRSIIIDFGIAKDLTSSFTVSGIGLGTSLYMAPEQFTDCSRVTQKTDIYSFGVVLYEMLTGEVPFNGKNSIELYNLHSNKPVPNVRDKNPDLQKGIENIIFKAMAKKPKGRYDNVKDFLNALRKRDKTPPHPKIKYIISVIAFAIAAFIVLISYIPNRQYEGLIASAKAHIESKEWEKASESLKKAKEIRGSDTEEIAALLKEISEKQIAPMRSDFESLKKFLDGGAPNEEKLEKCRAFLGKHQNTTENKDTKAMRDETTRFISQFNTEFEDDKEYNTIREEINLNKYLDFARKYPKSVHLPDLRDILKTADKNLPPDKYWDKPIRTNEKGYYEITFGSEHNGHLMIYIPEKGICIDKYEVSWAKFRKFLQAARIQFPPISDDKIIGSGDEYPAVVTFKDAQNYCQSYGLRLPSVEDWEYAAGKGKSIYPWGNESPDENGIWRANYDSLEGVVEKDGFEGTAPFKSFEKFSSPFGIVNMSGNVWEWVQGNILKGGGFFSSKEDLKIKSSKPGNSDKEGFRCIKLEK